MEVVAGLGPVVVESGPNNVVDRLTGGTEVVRRVVFRQTHSRIL